MIEQPDAASFCDRTLQLVRNRPRTVTYDTLAEATGLKASWIEAFACNRIPDPGVRKVEKLYAFFVKA
jgi:hypothetical protein